jgi:MHS family proline/betaine transporter-like MFS transporter
MRTVESGGSTDAPVDQDDNANRPSSTRITNLASAMIDGQSELSASAHSLTIEEKYMKHEEESFYSAPENEHGDDNVWGLLSGVMGNIYEWYDFAVYGLLAPEIGGAFFPDSSQELQLLSSFGVYMAAFLMRPLGAIFFGELGDRMVGRKNALVFSIVLITVPSVLMGMLPGYNRWGIIAPIVLVLLRMVQGLSVGGQLAGSYIISIEQSTSRNRGFRGSICDASSVGGFLLASGITTFVRHMFTEEQVDAWAWRIPFWFSLLLAPILYSIVKNSDESKVWEDSNEQKEALKSLQEEEQPEKSALYDLFSSPFRRRQLLGMVGVICANTGAFYVLFLWTPIYLSDLSDLVSDQTAGLMNFFIVGIYIVFLVVGGKMSDHFPHRMDSMRIGLCGIVVAAPVMFAMFESESPTGYFLAQLQLCFCLALLNGPLGAWEVELWMSDPSLSFTGVAIGHNLSACLFGGTMPLIATFLYYRADQLVQEEGKDSLRTLIYRMVPGFYVSLLAAIALFCISFVVRHPHDVRTGEKKIRDAYNRDQRRRMKKRRDMNTSRRKGLPRLLESLGSYSPPHSGGISPLSQGSNESGFFYSHTVSS